MAAFAKIREETALLTKEWQLADTAAIEAWVVDYLESGHAWQDWQALVAEHRDVTLGCLEDAYIAGCAVRPR